jgi:hypothetical protein
MDTRLTRTLGFWRLIVAAIVAVALLMALGATSVSAASPTACRVQNTDSGKTYTALPPAVDAARDGDRLTVRGTCVGGTVIDKKLVIEGMRSSTSGKPTLSGAGKVRVAETEKGVRVKLLGLVIMRGGVVPQEGWSRWDPSNPRVRGTGILNRGHMVLRDVVVTKNGLRGACSGRTYVGCDPSGWGAVYNTGSLILNGTSRFISNPDGVYNAGRLRLNGTSIISGRSGRQRLGPGGVQNHGELVLNGTSRIWPGGVDNSGTLTLNDASRLGPGGGVANHGTLTLNDASQISGVGTGVSGSGTLVLNDASHISDNEQGVTGGGNVTLNDTSAIRDNHLPYFYCGGSGLYCWPFNKGGGVYVSGGSLTLNDSSTISRNSVSDAGGGVYLATFDGLGPVRSSLILNDSSTISGNAAARGGGVWFNQRTATLIGVTCGPEGNVHANTPDDCGVVTP